MGTTNSYNGYNIAKGGLGANGFKHHSEDSKKRIGEANKGKHHTEDAKKKISENHWDIGSKNNPMAKSVICLTTKRIFYTIQEGSEYYGISRWVISYSCKHKSSGKHNNKKLTWKFLIWNHNKTYRVSNKL